jgi:glucokinase
MKTVGVDIGGTKIATALFDSEGRILQHATRSTPAQNGQRAILHAMRQAIDEVISGYTVHGIGVGTAGQVNPQDGSIIFAVRTLPDWEGAPIGQFIEQTYGVPSAVDNDVNAMAVGEMTHGVGAHEHLTSALFVAVGTGIGGALVFDGKLWRGVAGSAGEIGHTPITLEKGNPCTCGANGCLEAYASGPAIANAYYRAVGLPENGNLREVAQLAENGETLAIETIQYGAQLLGRSLAGLLSSFDPQALIIGGGVAMMGDLWWDVILNTIRSSTMPAPRRAMILRAHYATDAVLVGANAMIRAKLLS